VSREAHQLGANVTVEDDATIGAGETETPTRIGANATIRSGTVIYGDVTIGESFQTGHNALVRSDSVLGDDVLLGTNAVVDGSVEIGSHCSLQTGVYLPPETELGEEVFLGPHAVLTNDRTPVRGDSTLRGPTLESDVSIGANATVLPDLSIGHGSFVAAGAVLTEDLPPNSLAVGVPATVRELPESLRGGNAIA